MILPRPGNGFEWRKANGRPALVCVPLGDAAAHLFTTREWQLGTPGGFSDEMAWAEVAGAVGVGTPDLVRACQVHGTTVIEGRQPVGRPREADVVLARDSALAPAIQVADCVPLLMADPGTGAVAAVHAGWRGLATRAPATAVAALRDRMGSDPGRLIVALGPSIGACCYQVGPEVRSTFVSAGYDDMTVDAWFRRRPRRDRSNPPMPGLDDAEREDRWFFDSWAVAVGQLVNAGVHRGRVYVAGLCTASHPHLFCSYRRDGRSTGRQVGVIRTSSRQARASHDGR